MNKSKLAGVLPGEPGSGKGRVKIPERSMGSPAPQGKQMGNTDPARGRGTVGPNRKPPINGDGPTVPVGEIKGRVKKNGERSRKQQMMVKNLKANNGKMPAGMKKNVMAAAAKKALS